MKNGKNLFCWYRSSDIILLDQAFALQSVDDFAGFASCILTGVLHLIERDFVVWSNKSSQSIYERCGKLITQTYGADDFFISLLFWIAHMFNGIDCDHKTYHQWNKAM